MVKVRTLFLLLAFLLIAPSSFSAILINNGAAQIDENDDVIVPSTPTDVYIVESVAYDAPIGDNRPISHLTGILYWEQLSGVNLHFFINTSDILVRDFWDHETGDPIEFRESCGGLSTGCIQDLGDRFVIIPEGRSFEYAIDAYYDPDIVQDTGFYVIFNSQSVDFSLQVDGETVFAKVDYKNTITLPQGAGLVSYAPIDEGTKNLDMTDDGRVILEWEYKHRSMDSKHDPLMIEVTYSFDQIFLAFTEQIYQNQQVQQERLEEEDKLDILNASFIIISSLAIVASLISIFFAYLLARQRFEPKLNQARELPRRSVSDIEEDQSMRVPVKSLFLSALIIIPVIFSGTLVSDNVMADNFIGSGDDVTSSSIVPSIVTNQIENDRILQRTQIELQKDSTLIETTSLTLPVGREYVFVYVNTSSVISFEAFDENGNELRRDVEENRYQVFLTGLSFSYSIHKPYVIYDNHGMLVFMDRLWSEYFKPVEFMTLDDMFFHVDLTYTVLLPQGAYLYSASPSDLVDISTSSGRWNVTFYSGDRQMDAFHDVFETQVTFSYVSAIEALENLNVDFQQQQVVIRETQDYIDVARDEILLFALMGLIAPLISFLIAYWVFKRRYQKLIERTEQQQEENIFVEKAQIDALAVATDSDNKSDYTKSIIGQYWKFKNTISDIIGRDIKLSDDNLIIRELKSIMPNLDDSLLTELLSRGNEYLRDEELIEFTYEELYEYSQLIDQVLRDLKY